MVFDFWWLLFIPIAFALGWVVARYDLKLLLSESASLPRSYFQGLNFLLNEQPDKAIDAFIEMAKLDPETIELYFALGNLFRRRGETDRAIRVHQNLLSRADLPEHEHAHALFELGQDFLKAGMLDQAESTFSVLQKGRFALQAKQSLLAIFQLEREWSKAMVIANELSQISPLPLNVEKAHFYCELAQESLQKNDIVQAREYLNHAIQTHPANMRATILFGELAFAEHDYEKAIEAWEKVEHQNPIYLSLIITRLLQAYSNLKRDEDGLSILMHYLQSFSSNELIDEAYAYLLKLRGQASAHQFVVQQMEKNADFSGLLHLLEAMMNDVNQKYQHELQLMYTLIKQRTKKIEKYICQSCGFRARLFYWQCPGCNEWETYIENKQKI